MKRYLLIITLLFVCISSFAQVNIVNVNPDQDPSEEKFINGISTKEDIGGVDVDVKYKTCSYDSYRNADPNWRLGPNEFRKNRCVYEKIYYQCPELVVLTNYNSFPVNVIYEYTLSSSITRTGRVVLPPARGDNYPSKTIPIQERMTTNTQLSNFAMIVRKLQN